MKTVQDYLDLGLKFVTGDAVDDDGENDGTKMKPLPYWMVEHCNAGQYEYGNAKVESFAWRNNDGVKPDYKGLIDIIFECGTVSHDESAIDFEWSLGDENCIAKWRPVVFQSDDAHENKDSSFTLPVGIDSPELREALKLFNDYMETNPKFTIKEEAPSRTMTVNIEGHEYLIPSRTLTVSPKEDKPMKPVYTAEMHARNELPPVGAECEALCMDAMNSKHVWTKAKILMHHDGNECAVYCIDAGVLRWADEFKPIAKTIKVNCFDVPAPMSEIPEIGTNYFMPDLASSRLFDDFAWSNSKAGNSWLSKGICHSTKSAAIAHAKAMLGIDPNA